MCRMPHNINHKRGNPIIWDTYTSLIKTQLLSNNHVLDRTPALVLTLALEKKKKTSVTSYCKGLYDGFLP